MTIQEIARWLKADEGTVRYWAKQSQAGFPRPRYRKNEFGRWVIDIERKAIVRWLDWMRKRPKPICAGKFQIPNVEFEHKGKSIEQFKSLVKQCRTKH